MKKGTKVGKISEKRLTKYVKEMYLNGIKLTITDEQNLTLDLTEKEAFKLLNAYINHYGSADVIVEHQALQFKFEPYYLES